MLVIPPWRAVRTQNSTGVCGRLHGPERHARLCQRLERLYGALELARLLDQGALARRIETHPEAVRRGIEAD